MENPDGYNEVYMVSILDLMDCRVKTQRVLLDALEGK